MNIISFSNFIIPLMIFIVVFYGMHKKINIYDSFIKGSKEGLEMSMEIFPYLLGMVFAINIFLKSDVLNIFLNFLTPIFNLLKVPKEIFPMIMLRPISGSSTLVLMNDIFSNYGPDSFIGRLASTIQGTTDTTIYVITLYFGSVGIKKIRYALWAGLFADLCGIIASIIVVSLVFS